MRKIDVALSSLYLSSSATSVLVILPSLALASNWFFSLNINSYVQQSSAQLILQEDRVGREANQVSKFTRIGRKTSSAETRESLAYVGLGLPPFFRALGQANRSISTMLGAWRCSGATNAELIKNLVDSNLLSQPRVIKAMQDTDRGIYAPQEPYEDRPQQIGFHATISAPHMHAHAMEILSPVIPREGGKVLDVGCGSGYLTAAFARMMGSQGVCCGMDYLPSLVSLSTENIEKDDAELLSSGRVCLKTGDGWKGWAEKGPFDAIHVGAAAERIPEELVAQLKVGGRMVVPVGPQSESQVLMRIDRIRSDGPLSESYKVERLMGVVYVPLVNT